MKKPNNYWTYDRCKEEALKYKNRKAFKEGNYGAYKSSLKNSWLDEFFGYLCVKEPNYWTYDRCKEEASKYPNRSSFCKNCGGAYAISCKNGWLDAFFTSPYKRIKDYYNEKDKYLVYKYETITLNEHKVYVGLTKDIKERDRRHRSEKEGDSVYKGFTVIPEPIILVDNLSPENAQYFEWLFIKIYKSIGCTILNKAKAGSLGGSICKWNYDTCKEEASKYENIRSFQRQAGGAYAVSIKNGWLYEFFEKPTVWDYDSCKEESSKYKTRSEFANGNNSAYNSCRRNHWLEKFFDKKELKWNYETCKKEASKYKSRKEFNSGCASAYEVCRKHGWLDEFFDIEKWVCNKKWTYDTCKKEANKYNTRSEFYYGNNSAYNVSLKNKWLDEFFGSPLIKNKYWTYERCKEEASKYSNRSSFCKNCESAYRTSLKNKWLDDFFPNIKN